MPTKRTGIRTVPRIKAAVRKRDKMRCTECGMTNTQHIAKHGDSLHVHRIVPGSEYNLAPGVCVTLCRDCHARKSKSPWGYSGVVNFESFPELKERAIRQAKRLGVPLSGYVRLALASQLKKDEAAPTPPPDPGS